MPSPAYSREYRQWLDNDNFNIVYQDGRASLLEAVDLQRPDLVVGAMGSLACCYYTRGAVALLNEQQQGWNDIQCGYLATMYAIRFSIPLRSRQSVRIKPFERQVTEAVMTLALARMFGGGFDERLLRDWLREHYDLHALTGKVTAGRSILESIVNPSHSISVETLRRDRKECCQKRDAWPERPTEFRPFGILDVELALNFPREAEFPYPSMPYSPTEDDLVIQAITAYHQWNE